MVYRKNGTIPANPVGIERHMFMTFEFLPVSGIRVPLPARLRQSGYGAPYVSGGQGDFLRLTTEMEGIHSDPVGIAKLIELTGFFVPDVRETCLNCF